ncbi:hypothetical protein [Streptomyces anthocyanicus]|uniref:hypothetical protein n=1 Tax=Streptomyces anthocyanicus TaxID=68174 RepID=UPI00177E428F|nr:hypothetical protein [Streptomyces anthocyanicus]WTC48566.1 hypothetical protein OG855_12780 [Streptomyces anthocyanicus]GHA41399.1 hypothetical protein GCM10010391_26930 [Streptomyces anthocyanicus]
MSIWDRASGGVRAHWKFVVTPAGIALTSWSNGLYYTHRAPGMVLFLCGLMLIRLGRRPWQGITERWQALKRIRCWLRTTFKSPAWIRRWGYLKLAIWGAIAFKAALYPLNQFDKIVADPHRLVDYGRNAQLMLAFCFLFPLFTRWIGPKDDLLERLEGRHWRAMISRTLANFNGACGLALLLYALLFTLSIDYAKVLPALALTIGITTVVATHKMWARFRKLCTQTHEDIQALIRILEKPPGEGSDYEFAVLEAWDVVERDLRTRVDTGYGFGTRFAPKAVMAELGEKLEVVSKEAPGYEGVRDQVLDVLKTLRDVCEGRIDAVA